MNPLYRLGIFVVFVIFALGIVPQVYASATLKLSPSSQTVPKDSTFTIAILLSTGGDAINFVNANLTFPKDKLKVDSLDDSGTFITIWPDKTFNNDLGRINLAGGLYNPGINGEDLKMIVVRFKTIGNAGDVAAVSFKDSSEVYRLSDITDILGNKVNGNYTIAGTGTIIPTQSLSITPQAPTPSIVAPTSAISSTPQPQITTPADGKLPTSGHSEIVYGLVLLGFLTFVTGLFLAQRLWLS